MEAEMGKDIYELGNNPGSHVWLLEDKASFQWAIFHSIVCIYWVYWRASHESVWPRDGRIVFLSMVMGMHQDILHWRAPKNVMELPPSTDCIYFWRVQKCFATSAGIGSDASFWTLLNTSFCEMRDLESPTSHNNSWQLHALPESQQWPSKARALEGVGRYMPWAAPVPLPHPWHRG